MATCKECKHYQPVDESQGDCFGHQVPADRDVGQCPASAFEPKERP